MQGNHKKGWCKKLFYDLNDDLSTIQFGSDRSRRIICL